MKVPVDLTIVIGVAAIAIVAVIRNDHDLAITLGSGLVGALTMSPTVRGLTSPQPGQEGETK